MSTGEPHASTVHGGAAGDASTGTALGRLADKLDGALDSLGEAKSFAKSTHQTALFQLAEALMSLPGGLAVLYSRAHTFDEVGVFAGGPWVDPARLLPPLVAGSLRGHGVYPVVETLSELRMLAIATGRAVSESVTAEQARRFLDEVMALNLPYVFPGETEAARIEHGAHHASNVRLFALIGDNIGLGNLKHEVVAELDAVCAQRPIETGRIRDVVRMAARIPRPEGRSSAVDRRLERYVRAVDGPSELARRSESLRAYRDAIAGATHDTLEAEAMAFGQSMHSTGLVSAQHAVLLRWVMSRNPELVPLTLGLSSIGAATLEHHFEEARRLVQVAIHPSTAQAVYGLAKLVDRGLLQRREIVHGLDRLVHLDLDAKVRILLDAHHTAGDGLSENALLLAGAIAMLGQPLGIGQGHNPTCQAARGLSLWARHAPGYLLSLLASAATHGYIEHTFEGRVIRSDLVVGGVAQTIDPDLDSVSLVLVPHLDRLYDDMMRGVALRAQDGHKWVNPGLYGHFVSTGFATVFSDLGQTTVARYADFVRRFYAAYHPAYNDGRRLMYPCPLGLLVTNSRGDYLGPHAISLQRVDVDEAGVLRGYFFNPNNEGRQDWGDGVSPSVQGHDEREGESSLPLWQLMSRLYAYHYNPYEVGDGYAVPDGEVAQIDAAARRTWGRSFLWA